MKILYLNGSAHLGGAETSLLDLLASLRAARPDWSLRLITAADGPLVTQAEALGVPTKIVSLPTSIARLGDSAAVGPAGNVLSRLSLLRKSFMASAGLVGYVRRLRQSIGQLSPDLVHTNNFKMHILGAWSRPRRIPVLWHIHDYVRPRPLMAGLLRRNAGRCSAVVANSRSVADDVQSICGDRLRIHAVHNAIDVGRFSPTGPALDLDTLSGLPPAAHGTVRVGLVATFARWKGHLVFLRALSLLPPNLPIRGYIVGGALYETDGSQHALEELRTSAAQLGISHKVGFSGFLEEPAAAMRKLDIIVHASTEPEPFGLVIVQAMACGRPVIVSEGGGAAEIIAPGTNALSHPAGNASVLAEQILKLAGNRDLRVRFGEEGRRNAVSRFDRTRLASDLIPIYDRVVTSAH